MHRNGKVLLIKNDKGWDLPGGHIQQAETIISALMREIFEETGLSVNEKDITNMNMRHKHKTFFCVMLHSDDITLSDEHFEYCFFTLEEAMQLDNLSKAYRKAVYSCLSKDNDDKHKNIKIKIGAHAAGGMVPAGPK